jgi:uncharacterized protein YndB with AHSA1/START domain
LPVSRKDHHVNNGRLEVSTPSDTTLVLTRTFDAPRRRVWEAMFVPDQMRRWMLPPPGWTMTVCECDARAGGALNLAWKSADADPAMTMHGVFTEVLPHERIVHTETMKTPSGDTVGSQVETHEFSEKDGVTLMRITQAFESKDSRDGALASGMEECLEPGYRQLDSILARPE